LNTVEKFFNPANAPYQVSGFFHANYIERIRATQTGTAVSWMVQGEEGSVEMAAGRRTQIYAADPADDLILEPAAWGLADRERVELPPIVDVHVQLVMAVLQGKRGPAADQVALTAGTILYLLKAATSPAAGLAMAQTILQSGKAQQQLEKILRN
jgi:anthranilate phosphoribosyltransferase